MHFCCGQVYIYIFMWHVFPNPTITSCQHVEEKIPKRKAVHLKLPKQKTSPCIKSPHLAIAMAEEIMAEEVEVATKAMGWNESWDVGGVFWRFFCLFVKFLGPEKVGLKFEMMDLLRKDMLFRWVEFSPNWMGLDGVGSDGDFCWFLFGEISLGSTIFFSGPSMGRGIEPFAMGYVVDLEVEILIVLASWTPNFGPWDCQKPNRRSETLPETNSKLAPENGWQRNTFSFSFRMAHFEGRTVSFRECYFFFLDLNLEVALSDILYFDPNPWGEFLQFDESTY